MGYTACTAYMASMHWHAPLSPTPPAPPNSRSPTPQTRCPRRRPTWGAAAAFRRPHASQSQAPLTRWRQRALRSLLPPVPARCPPPQGPPPPGSWAAPACRGSCRAWHRWGRRACQGSWMRTWPPQTLGRAEARTPRGQSGPACWCKYGCTAGGLPCCQRRQACFSHAPSTGVRVYFASRS